MTRPPSRSAALPLPFQPPPPPLTGTDDQTPLAQRSEVMVRALLAMSEVDALRWQPQRALGHAEAALSHMRTHADRLNATLADNDETERFALSPGLWLMARAQVRSRGGVGASGPVIPIMKPSLTLLCYRMCLRRPSAAPPSCGTAASA